MQIAPIRITFYFGNIVNHYSPLAGKAFHFGSPFFPQVVDVLIVVVPAVVCFCFHFNNQIKIQCNPLAAKRKRAPKLAAPTVPTSVLHAISAASRLSGLFHFLLWKTIEFSLFGSTCFNIVSSRPLLLMGCFYEANISRASFGKTERERELEDRLLCIIVLCFTYSSTAHKHATPHTQTHTHARIFNLHTLQIKSNKNAQRIMRF